jgi:hypothetical protein
MEKSMVASPIQIVNLTTVIHCTCEVISGGYVVSRPGGCPEHSPLEAGQRIGTFIGQRVYDEQGGAK